MLIESIGFRSDDKPSGGARSPESGIAAHSHFVGFSSRRCLRATKPSVPCATCSSVCPVAAISFTSRAIAASSDCLGCGACAAECPTGAITVAGFGRPPSSREAPLRIECARVPPDAISPGSWIVPCFAGLRIADVVEAFENCASQERVLVQLVDRCLCQDCQNSGDRSVITVVSSRLANAIATAAPDVSIECVKEPLDPSRAHPAGSQPARSRRAFLRALIEPSRAPDKPRDLNDDRAALARLAARTGSALDARHFPAISLSDACKDHAVCAASCPTGALRREFGGSHDERSRIVFEPSACVACGRCADVCPEHALTFAAAGAGALAPTPLILRERVLPVCPKCEEVFAAEVGDEAICPACRKSDALFADLFARRRDGTDGQETNSTERVA